MAEKKAATTPASIARGAKLPSISRSNYLQALNTAKVESEKLGDIRKIVDGLRSDKTGEALAAINQLRHVKAPVFIFKAAIESVLFAQSMKEMIAWQDKAAATARARAKEVLQVIQNIPKGYWPDERHSRKMFHSLEGLYEYWQRREVGCAVARTMLFSPRKINIQSAETAVALRMIRDNLFPNKRAPHQPLQRLIEVALDRTIGAEQVREALRNENSIQAMVKKLEAGQEQLQVGTE